MNKLEEPATDQQLACLKQFGYTEKGPLTKGRAAEIIHQLRERSALEAAAASDGIALNSREEALALRVAVERARGMLAAALPSEENQCAQEHAAAMKKRQEFWIDTCREVSQMHLVSKTVLEFYKRHGCRFTPPTHEQVQEVFDALDSAMPLWDRDHPELFYQTLELNFPVVVRHLV